MFMYLLFVFQLTECCVNVLVGSFKETILAECPGMIAANETESECIVCKYKRILFQQTVLGRPTKILPFRPSFKMMGFLNFWAELKIV